MKIKVKHIHMSLVGERWEGNQPSYPVIGDAIFTYEPGRLTSETNFVLNIKRPPINYIRTFLIPNDAVIESVFKSPFRVVDSSEVAGRVNHYGIATLVPVDGNLCPNTFYYEMNSASYSPIWKCGRFLAHLDPHENPDYFTISNATEVAA